MISAIYGFYLNNEKKEKKREFSIVKKSFEVFVPIHTHSNFMSAIINTVKDFLYQLFLKNSFYQPIIRIELQNHQHLSYANKLTINIIFTYMSESRLIPMPLFFFSDIEDDFLLVI